MASNDITYDKIRIQVGNPCECWDDAYIVRFYDCSKSANSEFQVQRLNCESDKIVGWFNYGNSDYTVGSHDSGQVVCRILNDCNTTEARDGVNALPFVSSRYIPYPSTGEEEAKLYCGSKNIVAELGFGSNRAIITNPDDAISGYCTDESGNMEPVYYKGKSTPKDDIVHNLTAETKVGLSSNTSNYRPYVQYGTKNLGDGDIKGSCIRYTSSMFFMYIPCTHYDNANGTPYGIIKKNAFDNHSGLKGVWIEGNWGIEWNSEGTYNDGPFSSCPNIEIAYCPSNWVEYFRLFPKMKYINGIPYKWDAEQHKCMPLRTSPCPTS